MIEQAYRVAEGMGIAVWCEDEAGPFQTLPYQAASWKAEEHPQQQDHEYLRDGTAKVLTLFHPHDGQVRVKGVESATNAVLHSWLKGELTDILSALCSATITLTGSKGMTCPVMGSQRPMRSPVQHPQY